jgi:putative holliday junction resolvase
MPETSLPDTDTKLDAAAKAHEQAPGRLLALDLGARRVGVAVSDELRLTVRPVAALNRSNWKRLLSEIKQLRERFDARGVVIGLPLSLDGTEGAAAQDARRIARNLELSLSVPIFLQDERLTSRAAEADLRAEGLTERELKARLDSAAAALILRDFLARVDG